MGAHTQVVRLGTGSDGENTSLVSEVNPLPVSLTSGNVVITGPVTISTEVEIKNDSGNPIPVTGPLTDTQLRAAPVVVDVGTKVTSLPALSAGGTGLIGWLSQIWSVLSGTLAVSGPVTDAQLRATAVPVAGSAPAGSAPTLPPLSISGMDEAGLKRHLLTNPAGALQVVSTQITSVTATIASGASVSGDIDLGTARLGRIAMPAAWTAADLTLQTSFDGVTWNPLYDKDGTEYTIKTAASRSVLMSLSDMLSIRYLRIRSGTSALPVVQAAARSLLLVLVP